MPPIKNGKKMDFVLSGIEERPLNIVYYIIKKYFETGKRIADVGCGVGRHLRLMPENSIAIDVIKPPRDLSHKYNLILNNVDSGYLPLKDNSVDVVFCSHLLEHLRSPFSAMKEFHRVLTTGGVLLLGIPNPDCIYFDFYELSEKQYWSEHLYEWNMKQAHRFITNCGFSVDRVYSNFPFASKLMGSIWNNLPLLKGLSSDLWFVCIKRENKIYLKPSKRYILSKFLIKLGLGGTMSRSNGR